MERLRHSDYTRLLDFIAGLQEPVPISRFGQHVVQLTGLLIEGATIAFDQIHEARRHYTIDHNYPLDPTAEARLFGRLQEVYQQNPVYRYIRSGGGEAIVDIADLASRRDFHRTEFYQDIFRPLALEHQINVLLHRDGWINSLTINCEKAIEPATKTLLALASRHLILAHRSACLLEHVRIDCAAEPPAAPLTQREMEVFSWLREGKRNAEIATILGCSPRTIDKHVENILRKTGAETRTAAVRRDT